jgi:hypothetical protein
MARSPHRARRRISRAIDLPATDIGIREAIDSPAEPEIRIYLEPQALNLFGPVEIIDLMTGRVFRSATLDPNPGSLPVLIVDKITIDPVLVIRIRATTNALRNRRGGIIPETVIHTMTIN